MRNRNPVAKNSQVNRAVTFDDRKRKSKDGYTKHKIKESTMSDEREVASKKIAHLLNTIEGLLKDCENIADDAGVDFSWNGPSYGMGGSYTPDFESSDDEDDWSESAGWSASSQSC